MNIWEYFELFAGTGIGNITKIDEKELPDFEIMKDGSPCQGLSKNVACLNFEDTRSKLFF